MHTLTANFLQKLGATYIFLKYKTAKQSRGLFWSKIIEKSIEDHLGEEKLISTERQKCTKLDVI